MDEYFERLDDPELTPEQIWVREFHRLQNEQMALKAGFVSKSAEIEILKGKAVVVAEGRFGKKQKQLKPLQLQVGLSPSRWRKYRAIGQAAVRLEPYLYQLPPNWTVVYQLAIMPADKFEAVVQDPIFGRHMTYKQLNAISPSRREAAEPEVSTLIEVDVTNTDPDEVRYHVRRLEQDGLHVRVYQRARKVRETAQPKLIAFHSERSEADDVRH